MEREAGRGAAPRRWLGRALAVLLLPALLALAGELSTEHLRAIRALLARPRKGPPPVLEELSSALAALGPSALPAFLSLLGGELDDEPDAEPRGAREDGALLGAVALLPERAVLDELGQSCGAQAALGRRLAALRVLESRASPGGVETWLALAGSFEPPELESARVADPLRRALARMLARGAEGTRALQPILPRAEPRVLPLIVDATLAARRPEGVSCLVSLCRLRPGAALEASALAAAASLVSSGQASPDPELAALVRENLVSSSPTLRLRAAECALRLGECAAIPELIELLEDEDRRVQRQARVSLEGLSGRRLGYAPEPWRTWWRAEERWLADEGRRLAELVRTGQRAEAGRAIGELGQRKLLRDELLEPLVVALGRPEVELVLLACAALAQLGSTRAAPHLIACLEDQDERVRTAAWDALRALLGVELPLDPGPWRALPAARASN